MGKKQRKWMIRTDKLVRAALIINILLAGSGVVLAAKDRDVREVLFHGGILIISVVMLIDWRRN